MGPNFLSLAVAALSIRRIHNDDCLCGWTILSIERGRYCLTLYKETPGESVTFLIFAG